MPTPDRTDNGFSIILIMLFSVWDQFNNIFSPLQHVIIPLEWFRATFVDTKSSHQVMTVYCITLTQLVYHLYANMAQDGFLI